MSHIIETIRWNIPRGIDRSRYYITIKQIVSQAMHLRARNSDAILGTMILASLTNSYVEGSSEFTGVCCGQTVRNHLRKQDPSDLIRVNDELAMKMRSMGACLLEEAHARNRHA